MQSLRGTFATRGILIVIGALIAIAASAVTAVAVRAGAGGSTQTSVGAGAVAGPRDTITVVGEGTQNATPDNALISLGVSARRPTAADAMNTANAEMTAVLKAIKGQGVVDADIQTTGISIYQDQQYNVIGYRAGNTVNVKIHHIANVGTVIVAAQKAAGDDIQLNGINLQLSDNTTQLKGARQAAMTAAAARAKEWANLAGRHLGKVLSVSEVIASGSSSSPCGAGGRDSRCLAISDAGRAACRPRMMGSGGMRMAAGILWLTAGYTRELVTSSAIASPASSFVLAEATSMRGAIIIGVVPEALRARA